MNIFEIFKTKKKAPNLIKEGKILEPEFVLIQKDQKELNEINKFRGFVEPFTKRLEKEKYNPNEVKKIILELKEYLTKEFAETLDNVYVLRFLQKCDKYLEGTMAGAIESFIKETTRIVERIRLIKAGREKEL